VDELHREYVLGQLTNETAERLGFRLPPEVVLTINREARARVEAHGLDTGDDFRAVADALEVVSKHVLDTEAHWERNGAPRDGFWWDKLSGAYEKYWKTVDGATGFFLDLLDQNGIELPLPAASE
jgi:hypothetical protein